jgi:FAD:protein FMN transferase
MVLQPAPNLVSTVQARVRESAQSQMSGEAWQVTCRAMSTNIRLVYYTRHPALAHDFQRCAIDWIARFEARYSRFLPDSIVSQINCGAGGDWVELDEEAEELFSLCDRMHALSEAIFDPAALPLLRLWDWKANPPRVPDDAAVQAARQLCGWEKVQRRPRAIRLPTAGMGIDLGGIGKEYAADRLAEMARHRAINDVMVDVGQDLRVSGRPPDRDAWYIGLEEPHDPGRCWTAVRLSDHGVATSGDYFRSFSRDGRRFGHILDPRTGQPVSNGCQSASVIAPTCVLAGILSTAAFILDPLDGLAMIQRHAGVEGCITTEAARHQTRRFSNYVPM